jgi:hypothetical protein
MRSFWGVSATRFKILVASRSEAEGTSVKKQIFFWISRENKASRRIDDV